MFSTSSMQHAPARSESPAVLDPALHILSGLDVRVAEEEATVYAFSQFDRCMVKTVFEVPYVIEYGNGSASEVMRRLPALRSALEQQGLGLSQPFSGAGRFCVAVLGAPVQERVLMGWPVAMLEERQGHYRFRNVNEDEDRAARAAHGALLYHTPQDFYT